ncbi:hypothetical protein MKZ38_002441 [Zalerion maritima]|uniref:Uncharacterized protein n=1 Tax=Zalerion maritima TaxID=339359 RepID=A0AAD5RNY2_9PEZI|nr:hypothetical protein MKZ38_002441 [Zalerion maritima]
MVSAATSPWEAFHIDRTRQARLQGATKSLTEHCRTECRQKHVTKCGTCYHKLLMMVRERYVTGYHAKDWFAGRSEFIAEIDNMLKSAVAGKTDLPSIESRIMAEKKIWQQFAFPPRDRKLGDQVEAERNKLKEKTDDELDDVAKQLVESSDKGRVYANIFFSEYPENIRKKYVDMLKQGKTMEEVCEAITEDEAKRTRVISDQDSERRKVEAELAKLQRAKAASAAQKQKKKDAATQKAQAHIPKLPLCIACSSPVKTERYFQCGMCFVYAMAGAIEEKVVYCSADCHNKALENHQQKTHACSAGSKCIHAVEPSRGSDPSQQPPLPPTSVEEPVICRECLKEHHIPTAFCGISCAKSSFQAHRDGVHIPKRKPEERSRDEGQLDKINFTTYTAKNIRDHVISFGQAEKEAKEKDPTLRTFRKTPRN